MKRNFVFTIRQVVAIALLISGCASAKPTLYEPVLLAETKSWIVDFIYEAGELSETRATSGEASRTRTMEGQNPRDLQLRDDMFYRLRDKHSLPVTRDPDVPGGRISIHPLNSGRGGFKSVEVSITDPQGIQVARIRIKNGSRNSTFKDDEEFAEYAADSIADLFEDVNRESAVAK